MFFFKKMSHQMKWLYEMHKINQNVLKLYFMNILEKPIVYEKEDNSIEFSRDSVTLKMKKTTCEFYISKSNNVSFTVRFYDEDRQSKTFISKYLVFIDDTNITDDETLYYANQIITKVKNFLNDTIENLMFEDRPIMEKYLNMKDSDFKNLRKKELINDFIPKDLKSQYLTDTLDKSLKNNKPKQRVKKI